MAEISAGELDRRVSLLRPTITRDAENAPVETFAEYANVAASREDILGKKAMANGEVVAVVMTRFKIRWSPDVSGLSAQHRAECDGVTYDVSDVRERGRRQALIFIGTKRND